MEVKKQIFNANEADGKTVDYIAEMYPNLVIYFTDNTFIVYSGYALDGWHGEGAVELEVHSYENRYGKSWSL